MLHGFDAAVFFNETSHLGSNMKRKIWLLMATTVSLVFGSSLYAQTTVSDYERSLTEEAPPSGLEKTKNLDLDQLSQRLQAAGWRVDRDAQGNLVARRREQTASHKSDSSAWADVEQQLQQTGWTTRRDADGSLILAPPATQNDAVVETDEASGDSMGSFDQIQDKLRAAGWKVNKTADGNLLLYPPDRVKSTDSKPLACAGTPLPADIELPVDSWAKANAIAHAWLLQQTGFNAAVGKIRKVLNVHIVSIVADRPPYKLIQQIAIRKNDGAVIVLN